jgi:hypothetical protein
MINVQKMGILLLTLGLTTSGFAKSKTDSETKADGTLRITGGSFALGIGTNWGKGTLTYKGKDYPVKAKGFSVGRVGMTSISIHGEVFNLKHLADFNGHYNYGGSGMRGVTVGGGKAGTLMSNQAGVIIRVSTGQKGVDVNATGGGVDLQIQQ